MLVSRFYLRQGAMDQKYLAIAVTIALSSMTIVGDVFLKMASEEPNPFKTKWFAIGLLVFASSPIAWIYVFKHLKLATVGGFYALFTVLMAAVVGIAFFGESVSRYEFLGIAMASASLVLLARFN